MHDAIREKLSSGNCVAFVGAGFSAPIGMPGWAALLQLLLEEARRHDKDQHAIALCEHTIRDGDFMTAAFLIRRMLDEVEINEVLDRSFHDRVFHDASEDCRKIMETRISALVAGPWAGIITTNYDNLIELGLANIKSRGLRCIREAIDYKHQLGTILGHSRPNDLFFVKIHGSTRTVKVLSAEEYDQAYLTSSKIRNFLIAAMLRYNIVFIGSSIEDHILRIRHQICLEFEFKIPLAYALLPRNTKTEARAEWLRTFARTEVVYYSDGDHLEVDRFLTECELIGAERNSTGALATGKIGELRKLPFRSRVDAIGEINRRILDFLTSNSQGSISHAQIMGVKPDFKIPTGLKFLNANELLYRIFFLVSIDLVTEHTQGDERYYLPKSASA